MGYTPYDELIEGCLEGDTNHLLLHSVLVAVDGDRYIYNLFIYCYGSKPIFLPKNEESRKILRMTWFLDWIGRTVNYN